MISYPDLATDEADCHTVVPLAREVPVTYGRVYRGSDQDNRLSIDKCKTLSSPHHPRTGDIVLDVTVVTLQRLSAANKAKGKKERH